MSDLLEEWLLVLANHRLRMNELMFTDRKTHSQAVEIELLSCTVKKLSEIVKRLKLNLPKPKVVKEKKKRLAPEKVESKRYSAKESWRNQNGG